MTSRHCRWRAGSEFFIGSTESEFLKNAYGLCRLRLLKPRNHEELLSNTISCCSYLYFSKLAQYPFSFSHPALHLYFRNFLFSWLQTTYYLHPSDIKCSPYISAMVHNCSYFVHLIWATKGGPCTTLCLSRYDLPNLDLFYIFFFFYTIISFFPLIFYMLFLALNTVPCLPGLQTGHFKSLSDLTLDKELN